MTFADLGLTDSTLGALAHLGYERPTPIQEQAIPPLLEGRDVIGQAQTGTGKTAAFGLPMVEYVDPEAAEIQALVLTPTRELCIQVTQALRAYGERKGVEVVAVFGGAPIRDQATRLKEGQVAVGTVGRVMDMIDRHHLFLDQARYVVLDEADEMLDLGGRGGHPAARPDGSPDRALQRDGAARDPPPGRAIHARPGRDPGARRHPHD
jgi:ATP-dependent RNA helicase DeaD